MQNWDDQNKENFEIVEKKVDKTWAHFYKMTLFKNQNHQKSKSDQKILKYFEVEKKVGLIFTKLKLSKIESCSSKILRENIF